MKLRGMLAACAFAGVVFAIGCGGPPDGSLTTDSPLITWEEPSEADLLGEEPVVEDTGPDEIPPELQEMLKEDGGGAGGAAGGGDTAKKKAGGGEASAAGSPEKAKAPAKKGAPKKGAAVKKDAPPKKGP